MGGLLEILNKPSSDNAINDIAIKNDGIINLTQVLGKKLINLK